MFGQAIAGLVSMFFIIKVFSTRTIYYAPKKFQAIGRTVQDTQKELRSVAGSAIPNIRV